MNRVLGSLLVLACTSGHAQDSRPESRPALEIGHPAPPLTIGTWIKGGPLAGFEKGRVTVVEFWAIWCGPCIANMKHLTELQRKHGDRIAIVGVASADPRATLEKTRKLVDEKGAEVGYSIAWDPDRKAWDAWMAAAGHEGLPWAFVVNRDGVVAYIGDPGLLAKPLEEILAGSWDLKKAALARKEELARAARLRVLHGRIDDLLQRARTGPRSEAYASLASMVEGDAKDESAPLMAIAWGVIDLDDREPPDLAFAAAQRALSLDEKNPFALDCLAAVWFKKGDPKKAAEIQARALEHAEEGSKVYLRLNLKKYEKARDEKR